MKKELILAAALGTVLFGLAGCQNTVNTTERTDPQMQPETIDTKQFITDSFCKNRLTPLSVRKIESPDGLMTVQVRLRSERYGFFSEIWSWIRDSNPYHINYRFEWFDAKGMQVTTASSAWQSIIFQPGEVKSLFSVAPNAQCKDFVLSLQEYGPVR